MCPSHNRIPPSHNPIHHPMLLSLYLPKSPVPLNGLKLPAWHQPPRLCLFISLSTSAHLPSAVKGAPTPYFFPPLLTFLLTPCPSKSSSGPASPASVAPPQPPLAASSHLPISLSGSLSPFPETLTSQRPPPPYSSLRDPPHLNKSPLPTLIRYSGTTLNPVLFPQGPSPRSLNLSSPLRNSLHLLLPTRTLYSDLTT